MDDQANNTMYQGANPTLSNDTLAYPGINSNCYYTYPVYPCYPYGALQQTQYLTYPVYQTDPKIIQLLEDIKKLLTEKK